MKQKLILVSAVALLVLSGCWPASETPPPPFVRITDVSNDTPQIGEEVTIRWEFGEDVDSDFSPKVKSYMVQLHSLTFDGIASSTTNGCLPPSLLPPGQQPLACLPLVDTEGEKIRASTFDFTGPVMFNLIAIDVNDRIYEKLVKLKLPGMSFKASVQTTGWQDGVSQVNTVGLPRFGSNSVSSFANVEFERVFGIFENMNDPCLDEDGTISELQSPPLSPLFPRGNPFLLSSNNPNQSEQFGAARGSNFPFLDTSFLQTDVGEQFSCLLPPDETHRCRTNADALIFAGTFGVDGTIEKIKGEVEVITPNFRLYEPFFIQIDLRSTNDPQCGSTSSQQLLISDIHIGNLVQGLVLSTFRGHISTFNTPTLGEWSIDFALAGPSQNGATFLSTGVIKNALTGFNVHLLDGQDFVPTQAKVSAEWTNIPIFPDDNISGLRNTYIQFTP